MTLEPDIQAAVDGLVARWADYRTYQEWYDGQHDTRRIIDKMLINESVFKNALMSYSENLCPLVVNTMTDRLQLEGIETEKRYQDAVGDILRRARIDAFQAEVHRRTATQGDGYVLVWAYPGEPARFYFHRAGRWRLFAILSGPSG
jgi:hypothetical protein